MRSEPIPIACTLDGSEMAGRLDEWRAVLVHVRSRQAADGGVRLEFAPEVPVPELARLVAAEHQCCQFFGFAITVDERGVGLDVRAPADGLEVVAALFGLPD